MRSCPQCSRLQADGMGYCPEDGSPLGASDPHLGQTLSGQFVLEKRIGQGGCGDVYRAHQLGVERQVAIKFLHSNASRQKEFAARFAREARAAARLSHPNIVTVFQLGESEQGLPYIAMEWADASPIGRGDKRLGHKEILQAAVQIASALCEAHEAGIIHRDLKPENVLLGYLGGTLHVTLVDFGIAKIVNADLMQSGETNLTRDGVVYGTPQYLSPEQASDQPLDARADLYSFGIMLYELFAGRLPFDNQGMALLVDHLSTTPRHLGAVVPGLDPAVAALIMRLLKKEPSQRPASAREVLGELQRLIDAPKSSPAPMVEKIRSRAHGTGLGLMTALLVWLGSSGSLGSGASAASVTPPSQTIARAPDGAVHEEPLDASGGEVVAAPGHEAIPSAPQRALLVAADGYSLRVLVPDYLGANACHSLAVELWDRHGEPVRSHALVLVFTDASGQEQGVSVPAGETPGRYEIDRSFESQGKHAMQVLPERSGVTLRVHFDVEAEMPPNT
ncbi:MAG: serine/threonine protein kinase [Myxococcales bacterium]|nr:serine/threonine protein kinase [Myxococcales bacterium]